MSVLEVALDVGMLEIERAIDAEAIPFLGDGDRYDVCGGRAQPPQNSLRIIRRNQHFPDGTHYLIRDRLIAHCERVEIVLR